MVKFQTTERESTIVDLVMLGSGVLLVSYYHGKWELVEDPI